MIRKMLTILALMLTMTQGAWGTTVYVSTYKELKAAIENVSVDNIIVTANIDVPCETSGNAGNTDLTGASTAQLIINRSLTLQSQAGSKYIIKRVAANGATSSALKSMIAIRGNGQGNSGTDNLSENTVEVSFTNIIIDGGAYWGSTSVSDRYNAAADACGCSGRATIDIYLGATLNLEDGVEVQNGFTTKSDNSLLNDPSGSKCFGGAIRVDYHNNTGGGTINIKAGATIHDCTAQNGYGGALGAYNYARLNLYGGTIYNCSASNGGAIACTYRSAAGYGNTTAGTIRMYGGTISNCCAVNGGAFLMHGQDVDDYFLGGTITSCQATSGGAMYVGESNSTPNVHLVAHSSGWLTISSCTNTNVTSTESTGGYDYVYIKQGTISETPVYQVTFINNDTEFAVLHVLQDNLQDNSLGEAFPAAPVNAGLRFVGWYNGDTQITSSTTITENITVTAKWEFYGNGTEAVPYQIPSADAWDFLAYNVNNGNTYSEKVFQMTNNISVTTMAGVGTTDGNYKSFNGTFDGNGHTLNVAFSGSGAWTASFGSLNGATIKNLHITGSISTSGYRPGSIAGFISGNSTITNCWSEVAISSSKKNNWVDAGAFVGRVNDGKTLTLNGCLFTGSITYSDKDAYEGGGMVGWAQNNTTVKFYDCVFAPSAIGITMTHQNQYVFVTGYADKTIDNCYYNDVASATNMIKEGNHWYSITAGDDVTISNLGTSTATYNVSGITAYTHGIKYNNVYYAGNGDAVSLNLSHADIPGYTFSQYTVTGGGTLASPTSNSTTLTMTNANQTINATWTKNEVELTDGEGITSLSAFAGLQCDVSYTREFTVGKTSTVCLPFAYTKQGTEGSFYEFTKIEKNGSGEYVATMTEPVSTTLAANTPYLFTPALSSVIFTGTITEVPATFTAGETVKTDWTFKGTYETIEWTTAPTGTYGFSAQNVGENISRGEFVKVGEYVRIKPMRCYLVYTGSDANWAGTRRRTRAATAEEQLPETIKVRLIGANGEVTAIGSLHTKTGEVQLDGWYTLDGTRLTGKPTHKGIYVNNGRKVVIK